MAVEYLLPTAGTRGAMTVPGAFSIQVGRCACAAATPAAAPAGMQRDRPPHPSAHGPACLLQIKLLPLFLIVLPIVCSQVKC